MGLTYVIATIPRPTQQLQASKGPFFQEAEVSWDEGEPDCSKGSSDQARNIEDQCEGDHRFAVSSEVETCSFRMQKPSLKANNRETNAAFTDQRIKSPLALKKATSREKSATRPNAGMARVASKRPSMRPLASPAARPLSRPTTNRLAVHKDLVIARQQGSPW